MKRKPGRAASLSLRSDWRKEVMENGKYWRWRERKKKGKIKYGGTFQTLPDERKKEYKANKAAYHARRGGRVAKLGSKLLPRSRASRGRLQRGHNADPGD